MNKQIFIGSHELAAITILLIGSKILYTSLSTVVYKVGTASWYMTLISCITAIMLFLLVYMLMKRFPGKNIMQVFEEVMGKIIGKILSFSLAAYIMYYAGMNLREFVEMIKTYNLPRTPPSVILGSFIILVLVIVYKGLNCIGRISYIAIFPIIIGIILIFVMAIPLYNVDYIKPYFGFGLKNTIITGVLRSSAYEEVMLLPLIADLFNTKKLKKVGLFSLISCGVMFSMAFLCYLMTFQYTIGGENLSGLYQMAKDIYINRFFQRVDSIFLFAWITTSVINVAISFYIPIRIYSQIFKIPDYKPLLLPFAFILFTISILPSNISEVVFVHMDLIRQYSFTVVFGVPVFVLLISLILKKEGKQNAKET